MEIVMTVLRRHVVIAGMGLARQRRRRVRRVRMLMILRVLVLLRGLV